MTGGIVVIATLGGPVADRIHQIQLRHDPRLAAELPPHVTLAGSSGMGPIHPSTAAGELHARLEPIAASTPAIPIEFQSPIRFMQTDLIVLPLDPHGPLRALHERIKMSGLVYDRPRFAFTPHCTLSFYPQLTARSRRELLAVRVPETLFIDHIACSRRDAAGRTTTLLQLTLAGHATGR